MVTADLMLLISGFRPFIYLLYTVSLYYQDWTLLFGKFPSLQNFPIYYELNDNLFEIKLSANINPF
jgi:hypothetical protein